MRKRTTINIDTALVREAGAILGTEETTETIHRALREVVNREKRRRVLAYDFPGLTPQMLEEMRSGRVTLDEPAQPA